MLSVLTVTAGLLTLLWSTGLFWLRRNVEASAVFPEKRPRWLLILVWIYLTLTLACWFRVSAHITASGSLAAAIVTLAAAKFLYFYFNYFRLHAMLCMMWENNPMLLFIQISGMVTGFLMLISAGLVS